jgi:hypothetical protein
VLSAEFSADGRAVLTVGADGTVRVWPVLVACCKTWDDAERLANLAEAISGSEMTDTGSLRSVDGFKRWQSAMSGPAAASPAPSLTLEWLIRRFAPLP